MADEQGTPLQPIAMVDMATRRSADFRSIYANNTKFGLSPFEVSFIFSEITESVEGKLYVEQKVRVAMPPLQAKLLLLILAQNLQNFENQFGLINVPSQFLEFVQSASQIETPKPAPPTE